MFDKLGYKFCHIVEAAWTQTFSDGFEALKAKFCGRREPYQGLQFDKLFGGYRVSLCSQGDCLSGVMLEAWIIGLDCYRYLCLTFVDLS